MQLNSNTKAFLFEGKNNKNAPTLQGIDKDKKAAMLQQNNKKLH